MATLSDGARGTVGRGLGVVLGGSWRLWAGSWGLLGRSCGDLGAILAALRGKMAPKGAQMVLKGKLISTYQRKSEHIKNIEKLKEN